MLTVLKVIWSHSLTVYLFVGIFTPQMSIYLKERGKIGLNEFCHLNCSSEDCDALQCPLEDIVALSVTAL